MIWFIGLVIALMSGLAAMGAIAKNKAPELAISLSPINGFAFENIVSKAVKASIAENGGKFPDDIDPKATEFARKAFFAEPATPAAIAVLALGQAQQNRQQLMGEALSLSRRQPLITAWMIIESGAQNDMSALLNHYDTMLRTSTSAASVIIPLMTDVLANDDFISPFARLLKKQPPWADQFWAAAAANPESISNAADLRKMLYQPDETDDIYLDALLISGLVQNQQFEQAERLYLHLVGAKEKRSLIQNGSFNVKTKYAPVDWQLFSTGEYGAAITGGSLELSAIRNSGGLFARQLVGLPRRTVTLEVSPSAAIEDNAVIFITLTCAQAITDAPRPIRIPLKSKIEKLQINNSHSGCSFYWLDVSGRASENGDGFDISIDSISLT